ncbi:lantibiotic dehydratase [Streptomyces sp. NPDC056632]|uniref:lantibiotic dehydratase n=1 Tax=Streptomyces sp. NPDC056632 TaxID=3345884 RepID=UPI0036BA39A8
MKLWTPDEVLFSPEGEARVHVPLLPYESLRDTWREDDHEQVATALADDELVREAVAVASPSLDAALSRIHTGRPPKPGTMRRMALAMTAYRIRMAARATGSGPAGSTTTASFSEASSVRFGARHLRTASPDRAWLDAVVTRLERDPGLLPALRLSTNPVAFVRGEFVVVPQGASVSPPLTESSPDDRPASGTGGCEKTVRRTRGVRIVLDRLRGTVVTGEVILEALSQHFPGIPRSTALRLLTRLLAHDAVLTEARPSFDCEDPLGHVIRAFAGALPPDADSALTGAVDLLRQVRTAASRYAELPLGGAVAAWRDLHSHAAALCPITPAVRVRLTSDVDLKLPHLVAGEAARAASVLWRVTPPAADADGGLAGYHRKFLDRYGSEAAVPLLDLVDPETGLGVPASYRLPLRQHPEEPSSRASPERLSLLAELAFTAETVDGVREVILAEGHIRRLATDARRSPETPLAPNGNVELRAQITAPSRTALDDGDFRLVLVPGGVTSPPRSPDDDARAGAEYVDLVAHPGQNTVNARRSRRRIVVSGFVDHTDASTLPLDDLAIGAGLDRLRILSLTSGQEICPVAPQGLVPAELPDAARLILDISLMGTHRTEGWDWDELRFVPALPRVRHGRTVLAPATWRPVDPELTDPKTPVVRWREAFDRWCDRWTVPQRITLLVGHQRLVLNREVTLHQDIIRRDMLRRPCLIQEAFAPGEWLGGPGGAHAAEIVVPLQPLGNSRVTHRSPRRRFPAVVRRPKDEDPRRDWLEVRLFAAAARHGEILVGRLPSLLDDLVLREIPWFFVRHLTPEPHLRFCFSGAREMLDSYVTPRIRHWTAELRRARLAREMTVAEYGEEADLYGGAAFQGAVEAAFAADSVAVLRQRTLLADGSLDIPMPVLTAANHLDLTRRFFDVSERAADEWLRKTRQPVRECSTRAAYRREMARLADTADGRPRLGERDGWAELLLCFEQRGDAVARLGRVARDKGLGSAPAVLHRILHLNRNRLGEG